jgi:putative transposase
MLDVETLGVIRAADKYGIPHSTLSSWYNSQLNKSAQKETKVDKRSAKDQEMVSPPSSSGSNHQQQQPKITTNDKRRKRRIAKYYSPSQREEILDYANAHSILEAAKKFEVTRFTIYSWLKQLKRAANGQGPSPLSGPDPISIELQRDKEILGEWKRHPGLGPSQIRNQLRRQNIKVSVHTVRRVMEEHGYRPPKVKRQPHDQRFEAIRPNHLWHLDFVHRFIHQAGTFTLVLLDDFSRYITGFGIDDAERADLVINAFEQAVNLHGKPEMVIHDKGSAFWSWKGISKFTALLTELGIDQIPAEKKEWNGKLEVLNANLHKEFFDVHRFSSVAEMRRKLETHIHWYNHARTNQALGGLLVPADRYYGRVKEVLARIEAGASREGLDHDPFDLHHRSLDLFKVLSKEGIPEIWLMGKKIFSGK